MKGEVDIFQAVLANIVVVMGFIIVAMFIGEVSAFNAVVTKPSVEIIQVIDRAHQIEKCLDNPEASEIQAKLKECKLDAKYVEVADLDGRKWKEGEKTEGKRDHSIWLNIKDGGNLQLARLYVKV